MADALADAAVLGAHNAIAPCLLWLALHSLVMLEQCKEPTAAQDSKGEGWTGPCFPCMRALSPAGEGGGGG